MLRRSGVSLACVLGVGMLAMGAGKPSVDVARTVDQHILARLKEAGRTPGPRSDDAEYLRRVCLDLTGKIPTAERTLAFFSSTDPQKRAKLVEELLASPDHGAHMARIWTKLITAEEPKQAPTLEKFLSGQFHSNRSWQAIVRDLLTAEGKQPAASFVLSHVEGKAVSPSKLASATGRLFLGIQLQCAECHKHPFTEFEQRDFWGLAAFFSRVRIQAVKGKAKTGGGVEESTTPLGKGKVKAKGAVIVLPATAGKAAGKTMPARFPLGPEPKLAEAGPFRPALADWVTATNNPYFARAAVNRLWAHLFGRGLVHPVDDLREENPATHPAILDALAGEFVRSGHDLRHIFRILCATDAYQRTSRVPAGRTGDPEDCELLARMAVKVMSPDAMYDSLVIAMGVKELRVAATVSYSSGRGGNRRKPPRAAFTDLFSTRGPDNTAVEFTHGIPQALSLLNEPLFNNGAPVIDALVNKDPTPARVLDGLFLATLNRRPTGDESKKFLAHVGKQGASVKTWSGVLWILLNAPEFVLVP